MATTVVYPHAICFLSEEHDLRNEWESEFSNTEGTILGNVSVNLADMLAREIVVEMDNGRAIQEMEIADGGGRTSYHATHTQRTRNTHATRRHVPFSCRFVTF